MADYKNDNLLIKLMFLQSLNNLIKKLLFFKNLNYSFQLMQN